MTHIMMGQGPLLDLKDPRSVVLRDCAYALARTCRYNGNLPRASDVLYYSVAEHSVLVAQLIQFWGFSHQEQINGLLHDVHEALMGDITTPVKRWLGGGLSEKEAGLQRRVLQSVWEGPLDPATPVVKAADLAALLLEVQIIGFERATFFAGRVPEVPFPLPTLSQVRDEWGILVPNGAQTLQAVLARDEARFMSRHDLLRNVVTPPAPAPAPTRRQLDLFEAEKSRA